MSQRHWFWTAFVVLVAYLALLAWLGVTLSPAQAETMFGEEGGFEDLSAVFWLGLAAAVLVARPIRLPHRVGMALVAGVLAAREEGWHKKFTTDSLFKTDYYQMAGVPAMEKVLAGTVVLILLAIVLWLLVAGAREMFARAGWRRPWGMVVLFSLVLAPLLKAVDRAPSILHVRFGLTLPESLDQLMLAFEEGLESALPVLLLVGLAFYLADRQLRHA